MPKKNPGTEIATQNANSPLAVQESRPSFLQQQDQSPKGLQSLSKIVRPSMLRIVQKNSADELVDAFGRGSIVMMPDRLLIAADEATVDFVPILFWQEWVQWSPMKLRNIEPMIKGRTFDPKDPIARKAQSPQTWSEPHPQYQGNKEYNYRYCEHLNFLVKLSSEEFIALDPVLISFARTNYSSGQRLGKLALGLRADLFAGQYQLGTRVREGAENSWSVYTVERSERDQWNRNEEVYKICSGLHDAAVEAHRMNQINVEYDEADVVDAEVVDSTSTGKY